MVNRIRENEKRLDNALECVKKLEESLELFKSNQKDIKKLNRYYGSKSWFKDKEAYEKKEIDQIKAGVLSEDAVWNLDESIGNLITEMRRIVDSYK